jgi:hypothetical protein
LCIYSLHFKTKVTFGHNLRYKTKVTFGHNLRYKTKGMFGEISLKLCQTDWYVARNNVNVVDDELPSQSINNLHLFKLIFELDLNPNIYAVLCVSFVNADELACCLQHIHEHFPSDFSQTLRSTSLNLIAH